MTRYPHGFAHGLSLFGGFIPMVTRPGRTFFVDTANGNNGRQGTSPATSFATIQRAIDEAPDGDGTVIYVFPGQYAETLDITKRDIALIGVSGRHTGRTQIVGDGSTARATIRVTSGNLRGFVLANIELDTNGLAQPALHVQTSDTAASPTATSNHYRFLVEHVAVRSNDPNVGFLFEGATLGTVRHCLIAGPTIGLALTGSLNNQPNDLQFDALDFMDCVTADIATVLNASNPTTLAAVAMTNVQFFQCRHWDRGGTPVTNYLNLAGTMVNCHHFGGYFARDVADGTNMAIPTDFVVIGWSAAAAEFVIGA